MRCYGWSWHLVEGLREICFFPGVAHIRASRTSERTVSAEQTAPERKAPMLSEPKSRENRRCERTAAGKRTVSGQRAALLSESELGASRSIRESRFKRSNTICLSNRLGKPRTGFLELSVRTWLPDDLRLAECLPAHLPWDAMLRLELALGMGLRLE
jgi:hypothetical protein